MRRVVQARNLFLTVVFLFAFSSGAVAVTFDSASTFTSTRSTFSWKHVNKGNLLIVFVHHTDAGPSAITYQGASLTRLTSQVVGNSMDRTMEAWYLLAPPVGSGIVSVTTASSRSLATALSFGEALQAAPVAAVANGSSGIASLTVNAGNGDLVVDGVGAGPAVVAGPGQRQRANFNDGVFTSASSTKTGNGTVQMSWDTLGRVSDWAQLALTISSAVSPMANLGTTQTPTPTPTPRAIPRTPAPAACVGGHVIPQFVQLFGPVQDDGALKQVPGPAWAFPSSTLSTSTKMFWFNNNLPPIFFAVWRVEWVSSSVKNRLRLVSMDDGPTNLVSLAEIAGVDSLNPRSATINITPQFSDLISARIPKHLGWQIIGDGGSRIIVYQSHLELQFCIQ